MPDRPQHFIDFARIHVKAGDGGDGVVAFRREKYVPEGGPSGGRGGMGGSIYMEADPNLVTLLDFKLRPFIKAMRGDNGQSANKAGRSGEDVIVKVPLGTTIVDADTQEELGDITQIGQRVLVAQGGQGGRGNESFATSTHRTPLERENGGPGQERNLIIELKTIADVGVVGLPNAGKSTLLSAITNAHPKIAPYPFTTLHPNLGVLTNEKLDRSATVADIPGLIEGAHKGAGLGDRFLRHIERTQVLVHLVSPLDGSLDPVDAAGRKTLAEDLLYNYQLVRAELAHYSERLEQKPELVCLNKTDILSKETVQRIKREFSKIKIILIPISARENKNLKRLVARIFDELDKVAAEKTPMRLYGEDEWAP